MKKEFLRIIKLKEGESSSIRISKGMQLKCSRGVLWLTACGEDIILQAGGRLNWDKSPARIAMLPIGSGASLAVKKRLSFFSKLLPLSMITINTPKSL